MAEADEPGRPREQAGHGVDVDIGGVGEAEPEALGVRDRGQVLLEETT
ncbi:hypothetical protein GKE56_15820 [Nostocoides sp. HKS02]|nr:hypothetical protein [Tetrasphaera sp. HKS02]QGN59111.1 hypothetical protein GKE56_15820 [Tetrasphaera sp. HKS02]